MQLSDRIGRRLKLQDLHVLLTVIQAGSMGKAAQTLNITQPAVSRSIAELEHAFGVRLLDRHAQGVEPTEYGRALLEGGAAVFDELHQTVRNIEFLADPEAGNLRIGAIPFLASGFVPAVVERLSVRHPGVVFQVTAAPAETLYRDLGERKFDFLVAWQFGPFLNERLHFEALFNDPHVVVAGERNRWVRRRKFKLADLMDEPWVLPPLETAFGATARESFRASGLDYPRAVVSTLINEVRLNMLASGRFLTLCSTSTLQFPTPRPGIKVLPVELALARVPVGIVTLRNRTLSPTARVFIEQAREVAKPMMKKGTAG
jgi:DNA-binding transcriptional LysR family regulator